MRVREIEIECRVTRSSRYQSVDFGSRVTIELEESEWEHRSQIIAEERKRQLEGNAKSAQAGLDMILATMPPEPEKPEKPAPDPVQGPGHNGIPEDAKAGKCAKCKAPVFLKYESDDAPAPEKWNADGELHYTTCPASSRRRRN